MLRQFSSIGFGFYLSKLLLVIISVILSGLIAWKYLETYHFDQVFYAKSPWYGYVSEDKTYNLVATPRNHWSIETRLTDLRELWQHEADNTDYPEKFDKSVFKVAIIGDSYMFGSGVLSFERLPEVLERKLNLVRPTKVYSFAQMEDDVLDQYAKFQVIERRLQPDVYIVGMVWNDFEIWGKKSLQEELLRKRLQKICLQPEYKEAFSPESSSWLQIIKNHSYNTTSPTYANRCYMAEFIKDIQTDRRVMFFNWNRFEGHNWCQWGDTQEHIYQSLLMQDYEQLIVDNDGAVFGIYVEDWEKWQPVSDKEAHPGRAMHALGAQVITDELLREPLWGFVRQPL